MSSVEFNLVAGCFAAGLVVGLIIRRWWSLLLPSVPMLLFFVATVYWWTEPDSDGATGADWFFGFFLLLGAPAIVGMTMGVLCGQVLWPPRRLTRVPPVTASDQERADWVAREAAYSRGEPSPAKDDER